MIGSVATHLPLGDVRVIDLTVARAGPTCVRQLADWGADVIRVEPPPDPAAPGLTGSRHGCDFQHLHRNKRSLSLNLKAPGARDVLMRLVDTADVLIENMRPPVKDRLGFDFATVHARNPRLVYGSISGFGQDGPYAGRGGVDQIAQGMGGLMSVTGLPGSEPTRAGIPVADLAAGLYLAIGVLVALHDRDRTGTGRWVQTSLLESMIAMMDFQAARWTVDHEVPPQAGNHHPMSVPMGCFASADGYVNIGGAGGRLLHSLCQVIGLPGTPGRPALRLGGQAVGEPGRAQRADRRAAAHPDHGRVGRGAEPGRGAVRTGLPDGRGVRRPAGRAPGDDRAGGASGARPAGHPAQRGADDRRAGHRPLAQSRPGRPHRRGAHRTGLPARGDRPAPRRRE